ncbi:2,4-dichlorophenol 6-monooxygenase [Cladobotryum mycophilum]|uniref:2,4-dichlorophenol 6-monooxygenase n=1 Tax=Cladobotryum mycophilum TaxID=491253 RepID=A0ABR0SI70_9HYPO
MTVSFLPEQANDGAEALRLDFLVVGAGPAGASLACFLGKYGFHGLIISSAPSSANTPRAHINNQATMECIRDLDPEMEKEWRKLGYEGEEMSHTRWCETMTGREYGRVNSWGFGPKRSGEYQLRSPCSHLELNQTWTEPILLRYATQHGFPCRFRTQFLSFDDSARDFIAVTVRDMIFNTTFTIKAKYLFGADGARSQIVQQLQLPLIVKPSGGTALNVLVRADLTELMKSRKGNLHYLVRPGMDDPDFAWWTVFRMFTPSFEQVQKQVYSALGDNSIPVEIQRIDKWVINDIVAEKYSKGNIFCLGDAVHRHPPMNGLGSNTCIQDAANLAWKINLVERGLAGSALLDTYTVERQPVGAGVVARANQSIRDQIPVFEALGFLKSSFEERKQELAVLDEKSERGSKKRRDLNKAIEHMSHEFLTLGAESNQLYRSTAVCLDRVGDEPALPSDADLYYEPHTYPGHRLPHAWLNTAIPGEKISTIDLAGKGRFSLFIGYGGEAWKQAAKLIQQSLNIEVAVFEVGYGLEYEAVYGDWDRLREVEEDGCVLVRPDNFVAWRSNSMVLDANAILEKVFRSILSV